MKITIAVAEDNRQLAKSISETIHSFAETELLFVASSGKDMLEKLEKQQPAVVLMDIHMPEMNGIEATQKIKARYPAVKVLILTVFDEEEKVFDAILAGASGYLLKGEKPLRLLMAIQEVVEGGAPMSASIAAKALQLIRGKNKPVENDLSALSARELEILEELSAGKNYNEIARKLFISPKTVRKHIENIYSKLQVHNKVEAVKRFNRF